ncbi:MAG: nodulation protein NfeD, partial [Chloroflexi bacterium]|nr:nodulation protein NfeD [Chloroflexota bacterium]
MLRVFRIIFLLGMLSLALTSIAAQAASPDILVLQVKGTVNPVLVDYIGRGIQQAEEENAVACIIQLDTPGGLDTA